MHIHITCEYLESEVLHAVCYVAEIVTEDGIMFLYHMSVTGEVVLVSATTTKLLLVNHDTY